MRGFYICISSLFSFHDDPVRIRVFFAIYYQFFISIGVSITFFKYKCSDLCAIYRVLFRLFDHSISVVIVSIRYNVPAAKHSVAIGLNSCFFIWVILIY